MLGYLIGGAVSDNLGRRTSLLGALSLGVIGYTIVVVGIGLKMVSLGMFFLGLGM